MTAPTILVSTVGLVLTDLETTNVCVCRASQGRLVKMMSMNVFLIPAKTELSAKIMSIHTPALVQVDSREGTVSRMTMTAQPPPA